MLEEGYKNYKNLQDSLLLTKKSVRMKGSTFKFLLSNKTIERTQVLKSFLKWAHFIVRAIIFQENALEAPKQL